VHSAALSLAVERPDASLTMEGIAARAGVSKQTLYRSWPSTGAILFDAFLARSADERGRVMVPDSGDLSNDLHELATGMVAELTDSREEPLLRAVTARLQSDPELAAQYRDLLLKPQLRAIATRLDRSGVPESEDVAELFVGPIFYRWVLRTRSFDDEWVRAHVRRVLRGVGVERPAAGGPESARGTRPNPPVPRGRSAGPGVG
jgi:AcrR family transcriptional regulator